MEAPYWFSLVKLLHIGGLVLWLGPSGGAWLLLQFAKRQIGEQSTAFQILYREFLKFYWVEHLGLSLLMVSGILLLSMYGHGALDWMWIRLKIALILCVIVPIEAVDIWFGHVRLPRQFSSKQGHSDSARKMNAYEIYERRFVPISLPPLLLTVAIIMWLAIAKPL
jgi:hypothetical protein